MRPGLSLKGAGVPLSLAADAARVRSTSRSNAVSIGGAEWSRSCSRR